MRYVEVAGIVVLCVLLVLVAQMIYKALVSVLETTEDVVAHYSGLLNVRDELLKREIFCFLTVFA